MPDTQHCWKPSLHAPHVWSTPGKSFAHGPTYHHCNGLPQDDPSPRSLDVLPVGAYHDGDEGAPMQIPQPEASLKLKFEVPVKASDVKAFFEKVPDHATIGITTYQGGHQRDPYPASYLIEAKWHV